MSPAGRDYRAEHGRRSSQSRNYLSVKSKVWQRAKTKLARLHPEEFRRLVAEEWKAEEYDAGGRS
jgi:hypothetical protein